MRNRPLETGELIGNRYRIAGLLGTGGMSRVYVAEDMKLRGKLRAAKQLSANPWDGEYLSAEADVLMSLAHPHLPLIVDYIEAYDDYPALLITDILEGESLQERFERCGCFLPVREIVDAALQLCSALSYLHSQHPPVIHRDLKPSNVMIEQSGFVRLIDFGIARQVRSGSDTLHLGTPGFAAPEQGGEQGRSDERSDIYGLGALLFYLLSGGKHYVPERTELRASCRETPQSLLRILERMLKVQPGQRYSAVSEIETALAEISFTYRETHKPDDIRNASLASRQAGTSIKVAIASFAPGAGATFIAVSIAKLLASQGVSNVYVEHYANDAETYGLLNGSDKTGPKSILNRDDEQLQFLDSRYARWREGAGQVLALRPEPVPSSADEDRKFRLMVERLEAEIIIYDISSHWQRAEGMELLRDCDICLFAADPFPSKWSSIRLQRYNELAAARQAHGKRTIWIANKDMAFKQRREWLHLIPVKPVSFVPCLPPDAWAEWLWRGKWATEHPLWGAKLSLALEPLLAHFKKG